MYKRIENRNKVSTYLNFFLNWKSKIASNNNTFNVNPNLKKKKREIESLVIEHKNIIVKIEQNIIFKTL